MRRFTAILVAALFSAICVVAEPGAELRAEQRQWLTRAKRFQSNGWICLNLEGDSRALGFEHGYLLAPEIREMLRVHRIEWEYRSGMSYAWLLDRAAEYLTPKADPESLAEIDGLVGGLRAAGVQTTRNEMIAYNGQIEFEGYWWPQEKKRMAESKPEPPKEHCSAFVATGSYTRGGGIVMGHNTMADYIDALANVIVDIRPDTGHRVYMQTQPGWIHSGTDFFVTSAGLVGCETTIGQFSGYDTNGIPEFCRMRRATQEAASIAQWCDIMKKGNNGGYANAWLLGDINTGEIARLELGLKYVGLEITNNGYFAGCNVSENRSLLRLETERSETDIRKSAAARRVRWKQLMAEYKGRITAETAEKFLADDYDVYLQRRQPGSRTLDGHFELDRAEFAGGEPYDPSGTFDGKVVDTALARSMSFIARWGSADGRAFRADEFLKEHPQYDWQTGLLKGRPTEPWTLFRAGK